MINKLIEKIKKTHAPIVVGLDPMLNYVPEHVQKRAFAEFGETLEGAAEAIWQFNKAIVDATYDLIPAVKPQVAMYEQFGLEGMKAFKKTVDYCHEKGLVVIGDVKRGDIGSTSEAYAVGHLGKVQVGSKRFYGFDEDFATVNPYLGSDGIKPFIKVCKEENKGLFILVKTSNPSSGEFQDRLIDGRPLYEWVGEQVAAWGKEHMGESYSYIGAVVGATYPEQGKVLRKVMPKTFILVPGYGAQGGRGKDLVHFFNEDGLGAIINSSRGIIAAYKQEVYSKFGAENFADASRQAVKDMIADIDGALQAAK
ncbi:MAG: orotidine-5'-phosphate decarboxylase [Oliverpabstia sp.]|nr:orotidine-5'-phosphate decarboxylase [Lachnospiraceae bacterium]MDY5027155.1 orotidine-5'-phosphate decarboxylase [Oliverpabstia sp.]